MQKPPSDDLRKPLTIVQWEIVERLDAGDTAEEAAVHLKCSVWTIRSQIPRIVEKLPRELVAGLKPQEAILVWRRWVRWLDMHNHRDALGRTS